MPYGFCSIIIIEALIVGIIFEVQCPNGLFFCLRIGCLE